MALLGHHPKLEPIMDASALLSSCELVALRSIAELDVGMDYWEDPTIRRYCALGLSLPTASGSG